jgi:hypothetical protein
MICPNCSCPTKEEMHFCLNCGSAVSTIAEIGCSNHAGATAVGACVVCGMPVCGDCAVTREKKLFCNDSSHVVFLDRHALLGVSDSEFEADVIVSNLKASGILPSVYSPNEFFDFKSERADSSVRVFVVKNDRARAITVLTELGLEDFIHLETIQR